jgi:hypothetical protein
MQFTRISLEVSSFGHKNSTNTKKYHLPGIYSRSDSKNHSMYLAIDVPSPTEHTRLGYRLEKSRTTNNYFGYALINSFLLNAASQLQVATGHVQDIIIRFSTL